MQVCGGSLWLTAHLFDGDEDGSEVGGMMTAKRKLDSLYGKTIRWTFKDGAVAGKTFEHTFYEDGRVLFRSADATEKGAQAHAKIGGSVKISDEVYAASYLADSGYTLTVVLDVERGEMVGFASNDREWSQQKGKFEVLD
jgi:hypothetical protein